MKKYVLTLLILILSGISQAQEIQGYPVAKQRGPSTVQQEQKSQKQDINQQQSSQRTGAQNKNKVHKNNS